MSIDLHIHSTASDGTLTPQEILTHAQALNLRAIAITDHDTVAGSEQALACGIPPSLGFLTGVEISASAPQGLTIVSGLHILGYGFNPRDEHLKRTLATFQQARYERNIRILERLQHLGIKLPPEAVQHPWHAGQPGRPHIAQMMVRCGVVGTVQEAFSRFLASGRPAYVEKTRLSSAAVIDALRSAGGIAVLAHPGLLHFSDPAQLERLVAHLAEIGIGGIEVFYPDHSPAQTGRFRLLAARYALLATGGTDFHGSISPGTQMGCAAGDFHVPDTVYENLRNRLAAIPAASRCATRQGVR